MDPRIITIMRTLKPLVANVNSDLQQTKIALHRLERSINDLRAAMQEI